jgi:hypothetical protein
MKIRAKRCTVIGQAIDPAKAPPHAPTEEKLSDGQLADHYVLCPEDRAKGYVEPYRDSYVHETCGTVTRMPAACAETYAAKPEYYGSTFCCACRGYFPVGADGQFVWDLRDQQKVGTRRANNAA